MLTVATAVLDELHVPPVTELLCAAVVPAHNTVVPEMVAVAAAGLTVIDVEVLVDPQPLVTVYDTLVVPEASALSTPAEETVATAGTVLLHVPPPTEPLSTA